MRKILSIILCICLMFSFIGSSSYAEDSERQYKTEKPTREKNESNTKKVDKKEAPIIVQPIEDPNESTVATDEVISVMVNGTPLVTDVAPIVVNGRTLVPLRAIAESLNVDVRYDETTNTVYIDRTDL